MSKNIDICLKFLIPMNNKMDPIIKRLLEIAKDLGISVRQFEISIGKSNGYINSMKTRNGTPGADALLDIIKAYPQYSLHYIITGEGSLKSDTKHSVSEPPSIYKPEITSISKAITDLVVEVIKEKVDPELKDINENILMLMKRNLEVEKSKSENKKKA